MTEDELDLLASAYLDGEATSEEVATVEADPELLARVEALRSVSEQLGANIPTPPGAVKEQHLVAALAAFDPEAVTEVPTDVPTEVADNVTSIGSAGSARSRKRDRSKRPARSMPQWLPAAAGLLLLGGGVIWLAGQTGSDDADTAAMETEAESDDQDAGGDESTEEAGEASSAVADADAMATESAPIEEDAAEDEEEAMEDSDTDDAADDSATDEGADGGTDGEGSQRSTTTGAIPTTGGFFPQEPVLLFDSLPDPDDLVGDLPDFRLDLSTSRCGGEQPVPAGAEIVGYLPVEIEAEPAELLLVVDDAGEESILIVDQACTQLAP